MRETFIVQPILDQLRKCGEKIAHEMEHINQ